jgi:hypothetical protein
MDIVVTTKLSPKLITRDFASARNDFDCGIVYITASNTVCTCMYTRQGLSTGNTAVHDEGSNHNNYYVL